MYILCFYLLMYLKVTASSCDTHR